MDSKERIEAALQGKPVDHVPFSPFLAYVWESPHDYFITWEDSSTQNYSPAQYDDFIGREIGEWCRLLEGAGKHYIQHACGHVSALIDGCRRQMIRCVLERSLPLLARLLMMRMTCHHG